MRIPLCDFSGERVFTEVERVLYDAECRQNAARIPALVCDKDGATIAANTILDLILT